MTIFKNLSMAAGAVFIVSGISATPLQATTLNIAQTAGNEMTGIEVTANFIGGGSQCNFYLLSCYAAVYSPHYYL